MSESSGIKTLVKSVGRELVTLIRLSPPSLVTGVSVSGLLFKTSEILSRNEELKT
jgi:hypothetical protein